MFMWSCYQRVISTYLWLITLVRVFKLENLLFEENADVILKAAWRYEWTMLLINVGKLLKTYWHKYNTGKDCIRKFFIWWKSRFFFIVWKYCVDKGRGKNLQT